MRVLPVLDVQDGLVVRGIAGRRREYRPIVSRLTSSADPVEVAEAFRDHFDLSHLYLADLDAIAGKSPAVALFRDLGERGFHIWVDAGVRDLDRAAQLAETGIAGIVIGSANRRAGRRSLRELLTALVPSASSFHWI